MSKDLINGEASIPCIWHGMEVTLEGGGRCPPQGGGRHQPVRGGTIYDQLVVWESWLQTLQTWSRSLPHVSLWLSTNQNLELRNFLSVRPPLYGKKQVAFKWIFRWFYAFWDPIFCLELEWNKEELKLKRAMRIIDLSPENFVFWTLSLWKYNLLLVLE